jgi:anti-sigma B factor antagonist
VCVVAGEIDLCTAPVLRRALAEAERPAVEAIVVDLSEVEFLGAAGLSVLVAAARRAEARRRPFARVVRARALRRVLEVTGVGQELTSYPSLSDAVVACCPLVSSADDAR